MPWNFFRRRHAREATETPPAPPRRIGLALGGGAVRGVAHLGVLAVLEREGIVPDVVAGTSAGSIVGAGVAAGVSSAEMLELVRKLSWPKLVVPAWRSRLSMFETTHMGKLLESFIDCTSFDELKLPFAVVACDLLSGKNVVIAEGPLSEAIMASCAIPALFEPVRRDGMLLVDGGLTDNVPIDVVRDLGADYVIAVDVLPSLDGSQEPADMRDVLMMVLAVASHLGQNGRKPADVLIQPNVASIPPLDLGRFLDAYSAGVAAAEAALPRLRADLKRG